MLRTLIADDEAASREGLQAMLAPMEGIEVVACCRDGRETVHAIREEEPGLVLLDIQMPYLNGFEVIQAVGPAQMPATVFITAFDHYALEAFKVGALDYLLKPYGPGRLAKAIQRAQAQAAHDRGKTLKTSLEALIAAAGLTATDSAAIPGYATRLMVAGKAGYVFVAVTDILWIEGAGDYVNLHLTDQVLLHRASLKQLEGQLHPAQFARIHKSLLVNVDHIQAFNPIGQGGAEVKLANGQILMASRRRTRLLLGDPLFRYGTQS